MRYADDTTLIDNSKEEMEDMAEKLRQTRKEMDVLINSAKTIAMQLMEKEM